MMMEYFISSLSKISKIKKHRDGLNDLLDGLLHDKLKLRRSIASNPHGNAIIVKHVSSPVIACMIEF